MNTFVSFLAGFFVFALAVSFIEKFVLSLVVGLIGFAIIHLGLELAVLRDLKKFVRGLYKLPIGLVAVSIFAVCMNTGLFHHVCTWDSPGGKPRGKASWERLEGKP